MKNSLIYCYAGLLALTLLVAVLASGTVTKTLIVVITALSFVKFWIVGFEFMELKKAHSFWKILLTAFGIVIGGAYIVLL